MRNSVWLISKYANIEKYGADTRQSYLCKEFVKAGHKTHLILSNSSHLYKTLPRFWGLYKKEVVDGVEVVWINTIKYSNATSLMRMVSWIQFELSVMLFALVNLKKRPSTVIASSLSLLSVLSGVFIKKFLKANFIFEVRDIWPQTLVDLKNIDPNSFLIKWLSQVEKLGYQQANSIVGTMPGLKFHVGKVSSGNEGKVHFIPQGFSRAFYSKQQEVSSEYQNKYLKKDKFNVIYAGTIGQAYALDSILDAARRIKSTLPNVQFVFVGDGIEKERLKTISDDLGNVIFAPRVKRSEVLSVLSKADLLLHSFKMKPVFEYGISPNKFIDYMYAEKPIVCMFSGHKSMLNESGCGVFIESEDSAALVKEIGRLESMDKAQLGSIGKKGRIYLNSHHQFCQLAKKYMALF